MKVFKIYAKLQSIIKKQIIFALPVVLLAACGAKVDTSVGNTPVPVASSVTLNWGAPMVNNDGSPLDDLAGYKIYYGPGSGTYTNSINTGTTPGATISNLAAGTWCFATTAYDRSGNESGFSNEVCGVVS